MPSVNEMACGWSFHAVRDSVPLLNEDVESTLAKPFAFSRRLIMSNHHRITRRGIVMIS